ncbi:MAG: hypothetical protein EKK47_10900 [Burkholderiales bacterium]|jgi:hypothetical protein|nr:MAG: hypothetical protein EKK47_10900 [Burkholderiales bacterium]
MNGRLLAVAILGLVAFLFVVWVVKDRIVTGAMEPGAKTRLRVALIFIAVAGWLFWLDRQT